MKLYLFEKPAQARAIAPILGAVERGDGCLRGRDVIVTWCVGHLLELAEPAAYDPIDKAWRLDRLPILPKVWRLAPKAKSEKQLKAIDECLKVATSVVIGTDPDREGEMIAREVLERMRWRGPVLRLWLSATDPVSVRKALAQLRDGRETEPLYHAAYARSRADWLIGINLTRAMTCALRNGRTQGKEVVSIGRVQTPTLKLLVDRHRQIEQFLPISYWTVDLTLAASSSRFVARWQAPAAVCDSEGRCTNEQAARTMAQQAQDGRAMVAAVAVENKRERPPLPYTLSTLQQDASKRFGLSAQQVMDATQALYDSHKAVSYPRTDCAYLPDSQRQDAPAITQSLAHIDPALRTLVQQTNLARKASCWNDEKLTAHHAIVPTGYNRVQLARMSDVEQKIFALICRRYIAQFLADFEYEVTRIRLDFGGHQFVAAGRVTRIEGWRIVQAWEMDGVVDETPPEDVRQNLPALVKGQLITVVDGNCVRRATEPPKYYSDGTLIAAMESVDKFIDDARLKEILRRKEKAGIGTDATRPEVIETLIRRGYVRRKKQYLQVTPLASQLIASIPAMLSDPASTALWEFELERIADGSGDVAKFLHEQCNAVSGHVAAIRAMAPAIGEQLSAAVTAAPAQPRQGIRNANRASAKSSDGVSHDTGAATKKGAGAPCPECGRGELVRRSVKQGKNAGRSFLGCTRYPACKHFEWAREAS